MTPEQRERIIQLLKSGEDVSPEWSRILFPPEKREYELVYHGKEREEDIIANTLAVPLQPVRTFNKNGVEWQNKLIFGDNLQAMKRLLEMKRSGELCNEDGKPGVRLVYIDPPFASKQDFRGNQEEKAYQDKVIGAEFIEFVRRRLILLRELLSDDGSIFLHMDQRKIHYMKAIMDEVFGEQNLRNEIMLPGRAAKNLQQQFETITRLNVRHDTILWYTKNQNTRFKPLWIDKHNQGNPEGHWHHFWSTADRKTMRYPLLGITPETGQWTWKKERALAAVDNYKRYLREGGNRTLAEYWRDTGCALSFIRPDPDDGKPQYWRSPAEQRLSDTVWAGIPVYDNQTKYPTEKNEALLAQVLELASKKGDLVMDAFAGSGTTCAVAEKLQRRWIGIDCGKLAIYTIQKRLLNLKAEIGNNGPLVKTKPFVLYNAGLYDFGKLKDLPWDDWRRFALTLFGCQEDRQIIGGIQFEGTLKASPVLMFDYRNNPRVTISEETLRSLHEAVGTKVGSRMFIVAPSMTFDFQQDYVQIGAIRYYALRIPYSIIHELHQREFMALTQPAHELAVNNTVDAVGFDFIKPPELDYTLGHEIPTGQLFPEAYIRINSFYSEAAVREPMQRGNLKTLSMVMLDFDYDAKSDVFDLDKVFYASAIEAANWEVRFPAQHLGEKIMAVFVDIYGNESRVVIPASEFSPDKRKNAVSQVATRSASSAKGEKK